MHKAAVVFFGGALSALALSSASSAMPVAPATVQAPRLDALVQPVPAADAPLRAGDSAGAAQSGNPQIVPIQYRYRYYRRPYYRYRYRYRPIVRFRIGVPFIGPRCVVRRRWVGGPYGRRFVARRVCY